MKIPTRLPIKEHPTFEVQDATKIQTYLSCPRLYFFEYILGFRPEMPIHALEFGKAWHEAKAYLFDHGYSQQSIVGAYNAFLSEYRKTYGEETDMDFHPKSPGGVELALYQYVKDYFEDRFKTLHTEVGIFVPIGEDRGVYGKMDSIMHDDTRGYFSLETKTAGALWAWWADSWLQKFQISAYTHFLYSYYPVDEVYGVIIDGTVFRKKGNENVRVNCPLSLPFLESWLWEANLIFDRLEEDFDRLSNCSDSDTYLKAFPRNTESCVRYNRICPMFDICHAWHNPLQKEGKIPMGYKVEYWDPRKEDAHAVYKLEEKKIVEVKKDEV